MGSVSRNIIVVAATAIFLAAATAAALTLGASSVSLPELATWLFGGDVSATARNILENVRVPRVLAALLAGAALATSGALIQACLDNPLASPNVIGVNSGAGLFVLLAASLVPGALWLTPLAAFAGALFGFLWYNCYPAQVFMGDTGSLAIGGIIAVFALLIRKELLLPLLCGIFLVEALSVLIQRGWFKYTKRKYGEGQRLLLMAPVHHHFQKKGQFETKIVLRFWIISLLLAAITLVTLKIR